MSLLDAEQTERYVESLKASVQALEADLVATRAKLREAEAELGRTVVACNQNAAAGQIADGMKSLVDGVLGRAERAEARIAALEQERADLLNTLRAAHAELSDELCNCRYCETGRDGKFTYSAQADARGR